MKRGAPTTGTDRLFFNISGNILFYP